MQRNFINGTPCLDVNGFYQGDKTLPQFKMLLDERLGLTKCGKLFDLENNKIFYQDKIIKNAASYILNSDCPDDAIYYVLFEDESLHLAKITSDTIDFTLVCDSVALFNFVYDGDNEDSFNYDCGVYIILMDGKVKYHNTYGELRDCKCKKKHLVIDPENVKLASPNGTILMNNGDVFTHNYNGSFIRYNYPGTVDVIRTHEGDSYRLLRLDENGKLYFDDNEVVNPMFNGTVKELVECGSHRSGQLCHFTDMEGSLYMITCPEGAMKKL